MTGSWLPERQQKQEGGTQKSEQTAESRASTTSELGGEGSCLTLSLAQPHQRSGIQCQLQGEEGKAEGALKSFVRRAGTGIQETGEGLLEMWH